MTTLGKEIVSEEEQVQIVEKAKTEVKKEAFYMKRCLDNNSLMDALKHASNMICELRTSTLSPKNYYVLYIEASDHLRYLEYYLVEGKHGKRMAELYELVQYAGNILPRLGNSSSYLLITVGSVYIKKKEAPAKDVLRDLVEMCRGVQHPTRGLFLRTYLSEMTKDKLPDIGTEYEGRGGSAKDSIEFVLQNFIEMNKLWVRMQHQGAIKAREHREAERTELRILIGKNIARLSQLEGVNLESYKKSVLPRLLEQILNCKDVIAQQYLMECIIQAFPDDFHLRTLESLLEACSQLQGGVNIKSILVSLIDRLASYANGESIPADIKIFEIFSEQVSTVVERQKSNMPIEDTLALEASLLNLAITCYPERLDYADTVFNFCCGLLESRKLEEYGKPSCVKQILKLLSTPLESYKNILTVLKLEGYPKLVTFLAYENRKRMAIDIIKNTIEHTNALPSSEQVNKLLNLVEPLIKDEEGSDQQQDPEDLEEEQAYLSAIVHLFQNEDPEQLFAMYLAARKHFGQSGPMRIKYNLAPLVFGVLKLAVNLKANEDQDSEWGQKAKKVFKFAHETVTVLSKANLPDLSLRLFLQCAAAANKCGSQFETITYEFIAQALVIYEDEISDSQAQYNALMVVIGTLHQMDSFGEDNYDTLTTKVALYSSKLLKKPDQCRAVYMSSHLFWSNQREEKNGKRVLECLQKSLKIADTCMDTSVNVNLFVEILNQYLYYFENSCEAVTIQYLNGLIALINTNIANMESSSINAHYQNTLQFMKWKKETDDRYKEIES